MQFQLGQLAGRRAQTQGQPCSCRAAERRPLQREDLSLAPQASTPAGQGGRLLGHLLPALQLPRRSEQPPRQRRRGLAVAEHLLLLGQEGPLQARSAASSTCVTTLDACSRSRVKASLGQRVASSSARLLSTPASSSSRPGLRAAPAASARGRQGWSRWGSRRHSRHSSWEHGWHRSAGPPGCWGHWNALALRASCRTTRPIAHQVHHPMAVGLSGAPVSVSAQAWQVIGAVQASGGGWPPGTERPHQGHRAHRPASCPQVATGPGLHQIRESVDKRSWS